MKQLSQRFERPRVRAWLCLAGCLSSFACGGSSPRAHDEASAGKAGHSEAGSSAAAGGGGNKPGAAGAAGGTVSNSADPYAHALAVSAGRKVKTLLTGMMIDDDEVAKLEQSGAAGMSELIEHWTRDPALAPLFRDKMLFFFRNHFQQVGFQPSEDFKMQLLQNAGFDFAGGGVRLIGDDAYARLVQNIEDSFALTAWQLVAERRPLIETLTTQRYMMTTAMKSLYLQIEAPNDRQVGKNAPAPIAWRVDYSGQAIPLEQTLDESSPNYLVFDDQLPVNVPAARGGGTQRQTCQGGTGVDAMGAAIPQAMFSGQGRMFQRLLGFTPNYPNNGNPICYAHGSKPYFSTDDLNDWQWVSTRPLEPAETQPRAYDLSLLRTLKELPLALPRIGFYTTPAFLALWNTNDSNQHRVTANQTLLVALGASFTSADALIPLSTDGLDSAHAVGGSECYGCHKGLDPMRSFWGNQFDFNDRNDFPTRAIGMTAPNPRPASSGGVFAFMDVNQSAGNMLDFGALLARTTDGAADNALNGFARALTQKLCFYANSNACAVDDPEFKRIVLRFQQANYDFYVLIEALFASPLVTGASATKTFADGAVPISIARRDHLCAALSQRLGKADLCALAVPLPTTAQAATARLAGSIPADAFSRGSELPITPTEPSLFHRAAVEMVCENIATQVVDGTTNTVYNSSDVNTALNDFVEKLMNYPAAHPQHAAALAILDGHFKAVRAQNKTSATQALRSTFVLACEAPSSVGVGL